MANLVAIENIDELRRRQGIDLRLQFGDAMGQLPVLETNRLQGLNEVGGSVEQRGEVGRGRWSGAVRRELGQKGQAPGG